MKSLRRYIKKYLLTFVGFIILLMLLNIIAFMLTFRGVIFKDFGDSSPQKMLERAADGASADGLTDEIILRLRQNDIWAMLLDEDGKAFWSVDLPAEIPTTYSIQDVAVFSKGYLEDYPVFIWNTDAGLLVLGYPENSYAKLISNYYSINALRTLPIFAVVILAADLLILFLAYFYSKHKIMNNTIPIVDSIKALSDGNPVSLSMGGELSEVAKSINIVSEKLSKQNEARANWISGVSHDIRTPLSMILGYAYRITENETTSESIREQATIIRNQSVKIKDLVQDLNLVSQLEYEMQPLKKSSVRIAKLLRSYVVEALNTGLPESYSLGLEIEPNMEPFEFECDERLISRAVSNLVQNSMKHNIQGCDIMLMLEGGDTGFSISVLDNGTGITPEKLQEIHTKQHYMESTDDHLNLRHGLGLRLVRQIAEAHHGRIEVEDNVPSGLKVTMIFES
ncbi:MAG TPA: HAMP domain-containing histidine kinase [Candidatus Pelethocola excrementipullorum]|nr:HAMP domain-containing histidine kinase [Candidatus Pelethocola excrementipullorum]